jgi:hypothetical protein
MSNYDERRVRGRAGVRTGYITQTRTTRHVALSSQRLALENTLIGSAAAGISSPFIPRCHAVTWVEEIMPGISALEAHYESVPWPGEAYVTIGFASFGETQRKDLDDEKMEGTEIGPDGELYEWVTDTGDIAREKLRLVATIHTSFYANSWAGYLPGIDQVNSNAMTRLAAVTGLSSAAGKWRLLRPHPGDFSPRVPTASSSDLVFHAYPFCYEARGWNELTKPIKYQLIYRKVPVYDAEGNEIAGKFRTLVDREPAGTAEARRLFDSYNFAGLDNAIV